jgi:hypothetical protein
MRHGTHSGCARRKSAAFDESRPGVFFTRARRIGRPYRGLAALENIPLLVDFAEPTSVLREQHRTSTLPIVGNGPPGTFVLFPNGLRVSLPTDQIVFADDTDGHARVGFGGMRFVGCEEGRLVFIRTRELFPEDQLSPARSHKMLLDPQWVVAISVDGRRVWPRIVI